MKIVSGAATDTGQVREGNEDSYLIDRRIQLFAIADGMGGHRAGEVASATALEGLQLAMAEGIAVGDAVGRANTAVWDKASADPELAGMGTTVTAAWSDGTTLTVAQVGDSRAYLLRGETLQQVTVDHTLVEELIRTGRLTEEQAKVHPQRSIITRALGVDSSVDVDVFSLVLQPNDRVMLCSDGLTSMVRTGPIADILLREADPTAAANALVDAANAAGGDDNITVVVLDAQADGIDPLPSSLAAAITGRAPTPPVALGPDPDPILGSPDGVSPEVVAPAAVTVVTQSTSLDASDSLPGSTPAAVVDPLSKHRPPRDTQRFREPKTRRRFGRGLWRAIAFVVPILVIIGVGIGAIGWYAQHSYFVAFSRGKVVIYQGRPGGLMFWDPSVVERTGIAKARLSDDFRQGVQERKEFSDKAAAFAYVGRARQALRPAPSTTSSTTTSPTTASSSISASSTTSSTPP